MIVELRQYTLFPGRRDELIELFEREFVTGQEAAGITLLGSFRDLGDPDRFVWLRGFPDMAARAVALAAFYGGPVWRRHREAANATMIDSDDVLLLRPVGDAPLLGGGSSAASSASGVPASGFPASASSAPGFPAPAFPDPASSASGFPAPGFPASASSASGFPAPASSAAASSAPGFPSSAFRSSGFSSSDEFGLTVCLGAAPFGEAFTGFFEGRVRPLLTSSGAVPLAVLRTEYAANNFPALPIREGEHAFVWLTRGAPGAAQRLAADELWRDTVPALLGVPRHVTLAPTRP
jgi:NIPSNAP protein